MDLVKYYVFRLLCSYKIFILLAIMVLQVLGHEDKIGLTFDWNIVDGPVQLVKPDLLHKELILIEKNIKLLHKISSGVATVAVVGKFHSGKSFLMNQLMGKAAGFGVGPSVRPQTMGIWMWGEPMTVTPPGQRPLSVIFLDTEGFAANNISESYDAKIFAVATLLSSYLIYNSVKIIDQSDIDYLEVLSRRTQLFALRSQLSKSTWIDGFNHDLLSFPPLMWVVQDFVQTTEGLTSKEWLHRLMSTHSRENEAYEISLMGIFSDIDCHTLFLPATRKHLLANLSLAKEEDLTIEYREERDALMSKLFERLKPKEKNHKPISGPELAALLRILVSAANNGSLSEVPSRWDGFIQHLQVTATEDCLKFYDAELAALEKLYGPEPVIPSVLQKWQDTTVKKALQLLGQLLYGLEDSFQKGTKELSALVDSKYEKLEDINDKKIRLKCADVQGKVLLRVDQAFADIQLPLKTSDLQQLISAKGREAVRGYDLEVHRLISYPTLEKHIEILQSSLRNLGDSLILKNNKAFELNFSEAVKLAADRFHTVAKNTDGIPRSPTYLASTVKKAEEQALNHFEDLAKEFEDEPLYKLFYASLKEQILETVAKLHRENQDLAAEVGLQRIDQLLRELEDVTSSRYIMLPISNEDLQAKLQTAVQPLEAKYDESMADFHMYQMYEEQKKLLRSKYNIIMKQRKKENVEAFTREVEGPLNAAKNIILLTADKYSTIFSLTQYMKEVCMINLNEGLAKKWPNDLKQQIIENYINSEKELKAVINSRHGWWSSIVGFLQWLVYVITPWR